MLSINDVKVTKIGESTQLDANGRAQPAISVTWTLGSHGPFVEFFPKATFDQASALIKIKDLASKLILFPLS